jgi:hypothetical protein
MLRAPAGLSERRPIVKFMVFIYPDRSVELSAEERAAVPAAVSAWVAEVDSRCVRLQGHVFQPASQAATVRVRDGDIQVGHGPFAATGNQISGFNILECADLDEALEVAAQHPVAPFGTLELRPFADS